MAKLADIVGKIGQGVTDGYKKVENGVVSGYKKMESGAVGGFQRVMDACISLFFAKEGESVVQAKDRLNRNRVNH